MIIVQTPLRISLFGGGTDFPDYFRAEGGVVLSSAINKYVFVIVKERFDSNIRIAYTNTEIVTGAEHVKHELIREALIKTGVCKGVEILTMGDIPAGTGLGSSSAVTVGALQALYAYKRLSVSTEQLARDACEIEVDTLKKPIGFQDQYIAAFGGLRLINFRRDGSVNFDSIEITNGIRRRLGENLMLFFTGKTHQSELILAEQKENIQNNLEKLGKLKAMANQALESLQSGQLDAIGYLLHESWQLKKKLASGITNGEMNESYRSALHAGALGGKLTGAGGGGCLLLYTPAAKKQAVRDALNHLEELPFQLEPDGSKIIFNYRY